MLSVPAFRSFPEHKVTAYRHADEFWHFSLIPDAVSIRRDAEGKPVFQLIAYAFSDQDREENPELPHGGGYLTLDVELSIPADAQADIVAKLQANVDEMWHQLKAMADAAGKDVRGYRITSTHNLPRISSSVSLGVDDVLLGLGPEGPGAPPGDKPPTVVLSDPTWADGTFSIHTTQSPAFVTGKVVDGPLSLVGSNVASASLDLTAAGADFMVQTLTDPDGTGGADLVPIQAVFSLHFWAQTPPVKVLAQADSRTVYQSIRSIAHDYEDNGCDEDTMSHSDQYMQMAVSSGLVTVKVELADPLAPPEIVDKMRSDATKTVQDMLTKRFMDTKPAPTPAPDDPTKDFVTRNGDIYYLKSESDVDFAHFEYSETMTAVRKWPAAPQGTLSTFLAGMSAQELSQFVRKVTLDDPLFQSLRLHVAVFGVAWDTDPIDDVEVQVHYSGTDADGGQQEKSTSLVFTKTTGEQLWDPGLIGRSREYTYRYRIGYRGAAASAWSTWTRSTSNRLTIAVTPPGKVAITFLAGNLDFTATTKSVQIEVSYADPEQGVVADGTTLRLDGATPSQSWSRWVFVPVTKPVRYRTRHFLKNEQTIVSDWIETTQDQVFVNDPPVDDRLDVLLVPVGDWSNVAQTTVGLRYTDADRNAHLETTVQLRTTAEFRSWAVFLPAATSPHTFEYKVITSYSDGGFEERPWTSATGDQPLALVVRQLPRLDVTVIPALVDFTVTPIVELTLDYRDTVHAKAATKTFALTGKDLQSWRVDLADERRTDFTTTARYHTFDGREIVRGPQTNTDDKVVVERVLAPEVSCLMVARMLDFATTPVVEVDVRYRDPARSVDDIQSFTFVDATEQHYRMPIADGAPTSYEVTVTYYLSNGTVVQRDPVTLATSKIVVPRYVAA